MDDAQAVEVGGIRDQKLGNLWRIEMMRNVFPSQLDG